MKHSFFGGVHPATRKESTRRKAVSHLEYPPQQVFIPLVSGSMGTAVALVKPGDQVTVGQPLAQGQEGGVGVHASVSGTVAAIEQRPHPWGGTAECFVLDNDGQDTPFKSQLAPMDLAKLTVPLLIERVSQAGIAGMGGGAYPTALKLEQAAGKVDTLIVNAAECEPYVTADHRVLLEHSDQILFGSHTLARILGAKRAVVVTEGDKLNAVEAAERRMRKRAVKVELSTISTRYPLGAEAQIIQTVTGREIPPQGTPLDVKCLVLNVATVYAIQQALIEGKVLTHRTVTVAGGAVARPRNLLVPIGTPLRCLLESAGGLKETPELILTGGPMMGTPQQNLDAPVVKNTNGLICLANWERRREKPESICIRCGKCVAACPMHLAPVFICRAVREHDERRLPKLHPQDCLQCGCCSYICPARIPLLELVCQAGELLEKGGEA